LDISKTVEWNKKLVDMTLTQKELRVDC
jgi:hypothetical protein